MCDFKMLLGGLLNFDRSQLSLFMFKIADFGVFKKVARSSLKPASPIKIHQGHHRYMCDFKMLLGGLLNFDRSQLRLLMTKIADFGVFEKVSRSSLKPARPIKIH